MLGFIMGLFRGILGVWIMAHMYIYIYTDMTTVCAGTYASREFRI